MKALLVGLEHLSELFGQDAETVEDLESSADLRLILVHETLVQNRLSLLFDLVTGLEDEMDVLLDHLNAGGVKVFEKKIELVEALSRLDNVLSAVLSVHTQLGAVMQDAFDASQHITRGLESRELKNPQIELIERRANLEAQNARTCS